MNNTFSSDVNEIMLSYYLNGSKWCDEHSKKIIEVRRSQISDFDFALQTEKAQIMAEEFFRHYPMKIDSVWWASKPGMLSDILGANVEQKLNPSDVLVKFESKEYLGVSIKSSKGNRDIGFKNPGLGSIEKALNADLKPTVTNALNQFKSDCGLSGISNKRFKSLIRQNEEFSIAADKMGSDLLRDIRDNLVAVLNNLDQQSAKFHLQNYWLNSSPAVWPKFVKLTGFGSQTGNISVALSVPLDNSALESDVSFQSCGNETIAVLAGNSRLMKIRLKFASQKMASSIKFSGDPW